MTKEQLALLERLLETYEMIANTFLERPAFAKNVVGSGVVFAKAHGETDQRATTESYIIQNIVADIRTVIAGGDPEALDNSVGPW
jgi:hypothetical protein